LEAHYPSTSLLLEHGIIWVNSTRPWPSGKRVRNEDSGGSAIFIVVFLEGRLFPDEGFVDDALMVPGDKDRNATKGTKEE
jgi:hypothetical protein